MDRQIIPTADGSSTVTIPELQVTYHSLHGAIQESMHVFISSGFYNAKAQIDSPLFVFEMGLGTGLNALLTLIDSEAKQIPVHYTSIELFPLTMNEVPQLNYCSILDRPGLQSIFNQLHQCEWEKDIQLTPNFTFHKINQSLLSYTTHHLFDCIYYDAFAPSAQPELWTQEIFEKLFKLTNRGGILVTYCSKSIVRKAMMAAGYTVTKVPGPMGKREMVIASKL